MRHGQRSRGLCARAARTSLSRVITSPLISVTVTMSTVICRVNKPRPFGMRRDPTGPRRRQRADGQEQRVEVESGIHQFSDVPERQ